MRIQWTFATRSKPQWRFTEIMFKLMVPTDQMFLHITMKVTNMLAEITVQIRQDKFSTYKKTNYRLLRYLVMLSH